MTRNEKRILQGVIKAIANHNSNAWWELKRQIFDYGYQSYYPIQGEYDHPAQHRVNRLSVEKKIALIAEWQSVVPSRAELSDDAILAAYARLIVEEVINRARIAAYRTTNW